MILASHAFEDFARFGDQNAFGDTFVSFDLWHKNRDCRRMCFWNEIIRFRDKSGE